MNYFKKIGITFIFSVFLTIFLILTLTLGNVFFQFGTVFFISYCIFMGIVVLNLLSKIGAKHEKLF